MSVSSFVTSQNRSLGRDTTTVQRPWNAHWRHQESMHRPAARGQESEAGSPDVLKMVLLILPDHLGSRWRSWRRSGRGSLRKIGRQHSSSRHLKHSRCWWHSSFSSGIPGGGRTCVTVAPTITDNRGNGAALNKLMTTKFPASALPWNCLAT